MSNFDEQDDIPSLNRKDTENNLPLGWVIFFLALIVWGIYYIYAYTPIFSGINCMGYLLHICIHSKIWWLDTK